MRLPKADIRLEGAVAEAAEPRMTEAAEATEAGMTYVAASEAEVVGRRVAGVMAVLDVSECDRMQP